MEYNVLGTGVLFDGAGFWRVCLLNYFQVLRYIVHYVPGILLSKLPLLVPNRLERSTIELNILTTAGPTGILHLQMHMICSPDVYTAESAQWSSQPICTLALPLFMTLIRITFFLMSPSRHSPVKRSPPLLHNL